ncbi:SGNH/GDSL hydrolase family protein [Hydrogenophaga sp.]|uniref:SGNH/GDSL hydrolase family protein n=1 Tax=Hydrogenophaga sp. TaxID=1904254 RepID=UPI0027223DDC|nr:SGNH/GDSL hydrolase family protein [Hydrogenophaga sp.]MDO8906096.1 SGNH/GDSL hydrolase family protein [Hydrogenophaga sp.]
MPSVLKPVGPHTWARATLLIGVLIGFTLPAVWAQGHEAQSPPATGPSNIRWQSSLDAFAAADHIKAPAHGGVVFVGSSSIRMWSDLEVSFEKLPDVIKRGFGGSQLLDCVELVDQLVLPYKPRLVVVYAGENDLAEGASPQQVLARFEAFVKKIRNSLPESRIAFISIKPSPLRASMMPAMQEANDLILAFSQKEPQLAFIDVFSEMLDANGQPRAELFAGDQLHLNADGYSLWRKVISARL